VRRSSWGFHFPQFFLPFLRFRLVFHFLVPPRVFPAPLLYSTRFSKLEEELCLAPPFFLHRCSPHSFSFSVLFFAKLTSISQLSFPLSPFCRKSYLRSLPLIFMSKTPLLLTPIFSAGGWEFSLPINPFEPIFATFLFRSLIFRFDSHTLSFFPSSFVVFFLNQAGTTFSPLPFFPTSFHRVLCMIN